METNRDFILVTDKIADYELLLKEIPFPERMIVEVFSPEDYLKALKSGIRYPAYCIWGKKNIKSQASSNSRLLPCRQAVFLIVLKP